MTKEQRQMIEETWSSVLKHTNANQEGKDWWDSLGPYYQGIIEAYSKAMAATIICAPNLVDVSVDNPDMPKAVIPDITFVPAPEIKLLKADLQPVKPTVCSVDDLPKNDEACEAKQRELLDEFNKKHPLPTKEEIKEMAPKMPSKEKLQELAKAFEDMYDPKHNTTHLDGYDFVCTCFACPEQYDVYKGSYEDGNQVAYIRKRWGHLAVHPVVNGQIKWDETIYDESSGDGWSGTIDDKEKTFANIINVLNKLSK